MNVLLQLIVIITSNICWICYAFTPLTNPAQQKLPQTSTILLLVHSTSSSLSSSSSSLSNDSIDVDDNNSIYSEHYTVELSTPMGLILEEVDETNPLSCGVLVHSMDPNGRAVEEAIVQITNHKTDFICIRDKILSINGQNCANQSFDDVMDLIRHLQEQLSSNDTKLSITLGRKKDSIVVTWPNGVSIAATPGEHFCNLAIEASFFKIPYSCSNGGCGTCEQQSITIVEYNDKDVSSKSIDRNEDRVRIKQQERYMRPCVARVPKKSSTNKATRRILISPTDRYEPLS